MKTFFELRILCLALLMLAVGLVAMAADQAPVTTNGASIYLNVKDFGAVGDGKTDDTEAIQKALNAAGMPDPANVKNIQSPVLFFPAGQYRITASLTINGFKNRLARIEGCSGIGSSELKTQCQIIYDGPEGKPLLDCTPYAGLKISEITLNGNNKANILVRITSAPGFGSFGFNFDRISLLNAVDAGVECGDGFDSCASDMTFNDVGFEGCKGAAFRTMADQNVDYLFNRCAVSGSNIGFHFKKGGNAHFMMPTFHRVNIGFKIDNGGINAGMLSVTGLQLENFRLENSKKRITVLEARGEANVAFNSIFVGCINVFGPDGDLNTPNFILGPSAQVTVRDSMICGRIAELKGDEKIADKSNSLATWIQFDNCRFRCASDPYKQISVAGNAGYEIRSCHFMRDNTNTTDYEASMQPTFIKSYMVLPKNVEILK